jgi:small-conductance mechanosensitive channel
LIGVLSCLGTLGVDTTALVAGLGLTGLALGLAIKDAVSNFIAGLMIILYSPFELGDELEVSGAKGRVVDMDLRYVTIENESEQILIPNSSFLNSVVKKKRSNSDRENAN